MAVKITLLCLIIFFNTSILCVKKVDDKGFGKFYNDQNRTAEKERYVGLFKEERKQHFKIVAVIRSVQPDVQQKKVLRFAQKIFFNIEKFRSVLEAKKYDMAESPFPPDDPETFQAMNIMFQYTAFYAELIMNFPDITKSLFKKNKHWKEQFDWAYGFFSKANYMDSGTIDLFKGVKEELYLEHRPKDYHNPNWGPNHCDTPECKRKKKEAKKPKKKLRKGPRLTDL